MRGWILLLLLAHAVGAAAQAPVADWRVWALRMDKAQRSLNYDATMVIDAGNGDWDLVELSQRVGPGGPEQQWVSLNGAGRRQVRTAQGLSILGPEGDQRIGHGPQLRAGPLLERLEEHYAVAVAPRERIAGRQALKLSLQPVAADRYGLRLWIDVDTGLPLRSERLGPGGQMLERRMVTRLAVHGFAGPSEPAAPAPAPISDSDWKLPDGFRLVGSALAVPGIAGARHWVISDGVAWVSIYQMQLPQGLTIESNGWRHGALSQVTLRQGDDWFYLLGDLPPETLVSVGEAALAGVR
jgi:sigma-E factor negative regulatory protein RseB